MLQPRIADITTAGAASVTPSDSAAPIRNSKLVSVRTRDVEPPLEILVGGVDAGAVKNGTTVTDRMIIASGRPK